MKTVSVWIRVCGLLFLLSALGCTDGERVYTYPIQFDDGWEVSIPEKEGMDEELIRKAVARMSSGAEITDGFVLVKNGKIIADEYYNSFSSGRVHKVWSVTKMITGLVTGIAIEKGFIRSEHDSLVHYLSSRLPQGDPRYGSIEIEHLLTMSSGIDWRELGGPGSAGFRMPYASDWVSFVLSQPVAHTPGSVFNYSSGNTMLLAPVIKKATGVQADAFAKEHLFQPLGINMYEWDKASEFWSRTQSGELPGADKPDSVIQYSKAFAELPNTATGLKMLPRDLARIGQLYLNKGRWKGKQIVSESWIERSLQPYLSDSRYGYHWVSRSYVHNGKEIPCYLASGFGGQGVYLFPSLSMVLVFSQHTYKDMEEGEAETEKIIKEYILKAVKGI